MSDILNVTGSDYTSGSIERGESSVTLDTGALRRKYNFGDYVSELALAQDPFFRFVSMVSKKPTDDPSFKFTERRSSYTKRYAYMFAYDASSGVTPATNPDNANHSTSAGDKYSFSMYVDYNSNGNLQNTIGKTSTYFKGEAGTLPQFFIPGQVVKFPVFSSSGSLGSPTGYELWKVLSVDNSTNSAANLSTIHCECIKGGSTVKYMDPVATHAGVAGTTVAVENMEPYKNYVVGTAHGAGTGYPETWQDQPFSTGYGQTQIWKTSAVMNNTDRATVLKYEGNEWARIWKEKLIEHKWDIESALLFGSQSSAYNTTQGAVDYISTYGNAFSLDTSTKTQDSFLDDMSAMLDPRYNNAASTVFFCSTAVYNWLHKLSGYFANNIANVQPGGFSNAAVGSSEGGAAAGSFQASMGSAEMSLQGKKKVFGIDISTISTIYGDMNVARNVHLDGTDVKMIGINMKYCAYRPLVGNGINRDTGVYVGVQTLENSGVDRRVDQILTEAGMEWCCPETHAIWA